ncbi:MAG: hypothetical protein GF315_00440, partial [candidate division Zixibacteria bacterium]|nr:hypothetical protein [candidate division Zixibacteria bacterium]
HYLFGSEIITYHNNSPDTLSELYLHLYPNAFKDKNTVYAREAYAAGDDFFYYADKDDRGWIEILDVRSEIVEGYEIDGTIMRMELNTPCLPDSDIVIGITFYLRIPKIFSRLGHANNHYEFTQWYPKVCTYDKYGWHDEPYHYMGEYYSNFGVYDMEIIIPAEYVVAATGKSQDDVITDVFEPGYRICRYQAYNVHDFAWVADKNYILRSDRYEDIDIELYILPGHIDEWKDVNLWAKRALELYSDWYCDYPYQELKIVDVDGSRGAGMEYPGMALISGKSIPFTRYHEAEVIHEIAHQWFYAMIANNELNEAWLDEGLTTFTEIRYFETVYGDNDNILKLPSWIPFQPKIEKRFESRYFYYLAVTSGIDKPLVTPAYLHYDNPFGYGIYYSKAALILFSLREIMGGDRFDAALKQYCYEYRFRHPTTTDFIKVINRYADEDMTWFFDDWIYSDANVDFSVESVKNVKLYEGNEDSLKYKSLVYLQRKGEGYMPAEVALTDKGGKKYRKLWKDDSYRSEVMVFYTDSKPEEISVDPSGNTMDYYRWNNHYPRKVEFKFIWDKPSLDAYQLFFIPYGWIVPPETYRLGGIFQGRQFVDAGPILGKHQWTLFGAYDFHNESIIHAFNYSTPLGLMGKYTRMYGGWSRNIEKQSLWGGLNFSFYKKPFSKGPYRTLDMSMKATHYSPAFESDPRDVSVGSLLSLNLDYKYHWGGIKFGGGWVAKTKLGKDVRNDAFKFGKASGELFQFLRFTSDLKLFSRLYVGFAQGDMPAQEHFFLSGKLFPEGAFQLTWSNAGDLSSQERWHIWGDGNLRGFYGRHIKGKAIVTVTFEQNFPLTPAYLFFDTGYIGDDFKAARIDRLKSDFGLGLRFFNILRVDFPFWINVPLPNKPNWDFRIIVGLTRGLQ